VLFRSVEKRAEHRVKYEESVLGMVESAFGKRQQPMQQARFENPADVIKRLQTDAFKKEDNKKATQDGVVAALTWLGMDKSFIQNVIDKQTLEDTVSKLVSALVIQN
jgi:hypothetical protein